MKGNSLGLRLLLQPLSRAWSQVGCASHDPCAMSMLGPLGCRQLSSGGPTDGPPPSAPASRLNTWKGPRGQPPPLPPSGYGATPASAAAAAAATSGAGAPEVTGPLTWLGSHQVGLASISPVPKLLGFAGAVPFITLTPYVVEAAGMHGLVAQCAKAQVAYGALIVTFLGAVHWGLAMTATMSGPRAAAVSRERYVWSVFPSLAAWPVLLMDAPGPASLIVAVLLGICYLSDRSYARLGSLPTWYMALRGYLTTLAMISMFATTSYYFAQDIRRAKDLMAREEEQERQRRAEAALPPPAPPAATTPPPPVAAKKGWLK